MENNITLQPGSQTLKTAGQKMRDDRQKILELFDKIQKTLLEKKQWSSGEVVTISAGKTRGKKSRLYLRNTGGVVVIQLFVEGKRLNQRFYSRQLVAGLLVGYWKTSITKSKFLQWHAETSAALTKHIKRWG